MNRRVLAMVSSVVAVVGLLALLACGGLGGDCTPAMTAGSALQPSQIVTSPVDSPSPTQQRVDPVSGLDWIDLASLPEEASDTIGAIRAGGPFRFSKDGTRFRNAERILPRQPAGYYSEFTVVTPGESSRGARRIVTGGPEFGTVNDEFYYTADHYRSFQRIRS